MLIAIGFYEVTEPIFYLAILGPVETRSKFRFANKILSVANYCGLQNSCPFLVFLTPPVLFGTLLFFTRVVVSAGVAFGRDTCTAPSPRLPDVARSSGNPQAPWHLLPRSKLPRFDALSPQVKLHLIVRTQDAHSKMYTMAVATPLQKQIKKNSACFSVDFQGSKGWSEIDFN